MSSSSSSYNSPCAACKFLRRKCMPGCIFAPYFPPEEPQKFANVHKIFGASNVTKLLNELLPHQREDAVNSLAYEAEARVRDPVYGCVGAITFLQRQIHRLQKELDTANADLIRYACSSGIPSSAALSGSDNDAPLAQVPVSMSTMRQRAPAMVDYGSGRMMGNSNRAAGGGAIFYNHHQPPLPPYTTTTDTAFPYAALPWNDNYAGDFNGGGGGGGEGGGGDM